MCPIYKNTLKGYAIYKKQYKVIQYIKQKSIKGVKDCSNSMLLFPFKMQFESPRGHFISKSIKLQHQGKQMRIIIFANYARLKIS